MKIGFDATSLCRKKTGVEYYALNLAKGLLKFDTANSYVIFFRKEIPAELAGFKGKAKFVTCPVDDQVFCEQVWLPYIAVKEKVDLVHFPAFPPGLLTSKRHVFTIHDATIWKYTETLSWKGRYYLKPLAILGSKRAARVVTVSESSRIDIAKYAKISLDKVTNAGEAIGECFRVVEDSGILDKIRTKYGLPQNFILSVASIEPRKNLGLLLEAYKKLKSDNDFSGYTLVLVGRKAWGNDALQKKIKELKLEKDILMTGHIPDDDLVGIYNMAELFVYPSLYEGFGLPPLEAMACGLPVIASNAPALTEVLGDAAIFIDPDNAAGLFECMKRVLRDDGLKMELRAKGISRSKFYSWKKVAQKMIELYQSIG